MQERGQLHGDKGMSSIPLQAELDQTAGEAPQRFSNGASVWDGTSGLPPEIEVVLSYFHHFIPCLANRISLPVGAILGPGTFDCGRGICGRRCPAIFVAACTG